MTTKMVALKTFRGVEGKVRQGREFDVEKKDRADELERLGNAVPLSSAAGKAMKSRADRAAKSGVHRDTAGIVTGGERPRTSSAGGPARGRSGGGSKKVTR